jgi:hypothetical protein
MSAAEPSMALKMRRPDFTMFPLDIPGSVLCGEGGRRELGA